MRRPETIGDACEMAQNNSTANSTIAGIQGDAKGKARQDLEGKASQTGQSTSTAALSDGTAIDTATTGGSHDTSKGEDQERIIKSRLSAPALVDSRTVLSLTEEAFSASTSSRSLGCDPQAVDDAAFTTNPAVATSSQTTLIGKSTGTPHMGRVATINSKSVKVLRPFHKMIEEDVEERFNEVEAILTPASTECLG